MVTVIRRLTTATKVVSSVTDTGTGIVNHCCWRNTDCRNSGPRQRGNVKDLYEWSEVSFLITVMLKRHVESISSPTVQLSIENNGRVIGSHQQIWWNWNTNNGWILKYIYVKQTNIPYLKVWKPFDLFQPHLVLETTRDVTCKIINYL